MKLSGVFVLILVATASARDEPASEASGGAGSQRKDLEGIHQKLYGTLQRWLFNKDGEKPEDKAGGEDPVQAEGGEEVGGAGEAVSSKQVTVISDSPKPVFPGDKIPVPAPLPLAEPEPAAAALAAAADPAAPADPAAGAAPKGPVKGGIMGSCEDKQREADNCHQEIKKNRSKMCRNLGREQLMEIADKCRKGIAVFRPETGAQL